MQVVANPLPADKLKRIQRLHEINQEKLDHLNEMSSKGGLFAGIAAFAKVGMFGEWTHHDRGALLGHIAHQDQTIEELRHKLTLATNKPPMIIDLVPKEAIDKWNAQGLQARHSVNETGDSIVIENSSKTMKVIVYHMLDFVRIAYFFYPTSSPMTAIWDVIALKPEEDVRKLVERYVRAYGFRLTNEQYRQFSKEWREAIDSWQGMGYNVTWENGTLAIWSDETEISATLDFGNWYLRCATMNNESVGLDHYTGDHDKALNVLAGWIDHAEGLDGEES